jgi:hypothetical protein
MTSEKAKPDAEQLKPCPFGCLVEPNTNNGVVSCPNCGANAWLVRKGSQPGWNDRPINFALERERDEALENWDRVTCDRNKLAETAKELESEVARLTALVDGMAAQLREVTGAMDKMDEATNKEQGAANALAAQMDAAQAEAKGDGDA